MLEILNQCFGQTWPQLIQSSNQECEVCEEPLKRYGITYKKEDNQEDKELCFYDDRLKAKLKNEFEDSTWDYRQNKKGKIVRYYKKRFETTITSC